MVSSCNLVLMICNLSIARGIQIMFVYCVYLVLFFPQIDIFTFLKGYKLMYLLYFNLSGI